MLILHRFYKQFPQLAEALGPGPARSRLQHTFAVCVCPVQLRFNFGLQQLNGKNLLRLLLLGLV